MGKREAEKTACVNGHPFTPENTRMTKQGWRSCRECARAADRKHVARLRSVGISPHTRSQCERCGGPKARRAHLCAACRQTDRLAARVHSTLDALRAYAALYGRPPAARAWHSHARMLGSVSLDQIQADFGSWSTALMLAGLDPDQRMRERPPPPRERRPARDGNTWQARSRVAQRVSRGHLPQPNSLPCTDCGKSYREDGPRHEYDHYLGYAAEHHLDVEVVCQPCHRARESARRAA